MKNYEGLLDGLDEVAKNGITTVGDGRLYWKRGWLDVWNKVNDEKANVTRSTSTMGISKFKRSRTNGVFQKLSVMMCHPVCY